MKPPYTALPDEVNVLRQSTSPIPLLDVPSLMYRTYCECNVLSPSIYIHIHPGLEVIVFKLKPNASLSRVRPSS